MQTLTARLLERRAVTIARDGDRLALSTEAAHGVAIGLVQRGDTPPPSPFLSLPLLLDLSTSNALFPPPSFVLKQQHS